GKMRGEKIEHAGITIWNDCYNSNPEAAQSMIDVLQETPAAKHIAVLGEMLELGAASEWLHRQVGRYAAEHGVDLLIGVRGCAREGNPPPGCGGGRKFLRSPRRCRRFRSQGRADGRRHSVQRIPWRARRKGSGKVFGVGRAVLSAIRTALPVREPVPRLPAHH